MLAAKLQAKRRRTNVTTPEYDGTHIKYHAYEKSGMHNGAHFRQLRVNVRHPIANLVRLLLNDSRLSIYPFNVSLEELKRFMCAWDERFSSTADLHALVTEEEHHPQCPRPLPKMAKYPAVYLLACVDLINSDGDSYPTPTLRARLFSAAHDCHPKTIYNSFYTNLDDDVMNAVLTTISNAPKSGLIDGAFGPHLRAFCATRMDCEEEILDDFQLLHKARNDLCGTTNHELQARAISCIVEMTGLRSQAIKMFEEYARYVSGPEPEWHHGNRYNTSFADPESLMSDAVRIDKVDYENLIIQPPNNHEWVKVNEAGEVVDDDSEGKLILRSVKSSMRSNEYVHPEVDSNGTATIRRAGPLSGRREDLRRAEVYFDAVVDALICFDEQNIPGLDREKDELTTSFATMVKAKNPYLFDGRRFEALLSFDEGRKQTCAKILHTKKEHPILQKWLAKVSTYAAGASHDRL